jgi:thiol:disulfide interchange protein DsbD
MRNKSIAAMLRHGVVGLGLMTAMAGPAASQDALFEAQSVPSFLSASPTHLSSDSIFSGDAPQDTRFEATAWHDGEQVFVGFTIPEQHYLYRKHFAIEGDGLGPLRLPEGLAHQDEFFGKVAIFRDSVVMAASLGESAISENGSVSVRVAYQGCADFGVCYPPSDATLVAETRPLPPSDFYLGLADIPEEAASVTVSTASAESSPSLSGTNTGFQALLQEASIPLVMLMFFLAGLGLTFTPCVLPMVPIMSALIVGQNPTRGRAFALSTSYVAGMAATYTAVGILMGLFGASLNLQARLQSPLVLSVFAGIFIVLALAMMGAFDVRLPAKLATRVDGWQNRAQRSGPVGIAVTGALSVLVVSPCVSAPLAGALVFISSTGDALSGGLALLAMALGMGIPLILVGTFGTTLLPKRGAWMNGVKLAFGVMMLGIAAWLLDRVLPATLALLMWAGLAVLVACVLGIFAGPQSTRWGKVRQALAVFPLAWAIALIIGAAGGGTDPLRPLERLGADAQVTAASPVTTVTSLEALQLIVETSRQDGVPVVAHLTADWCSSCKVMERRYAEPAVAEALAGYRRVAVDITDNGPEARDILGSCKVFGPPSLVFFRDGERLEGATLQGEVTSEALIQHLRQIEAGA